MTWWRTGPGLVSTAGIAAVTWLALGDVILSTPDSWWHLLAGRIVLDRGALPATDLLSFTAGSHRWVMQQWVPDTLFALVERYGGLDALALVRAGALAGTGAIAAALYRRRGGASWWVPVLLVGALVASLGSFTVRANLLSMPLLLATAWLVLDDDLPAWPALPLFALWANVHGLFLLGLGLVAVAAAAEWAARLASVSSTSPPRAGRRLGVLLAAAAVGSLANPWGPGLHAYLLDLSRLSATARLGEWAPTGIGGVQTGAFAAVVVAAVTGLALARRRPRPRDAALTGVLVVVGFAALRNAAPAALVLGALAAGALPYLRASDRRSRAGPRPVSALFAVPVLALLVGLTGMYGVRTVTRPDTVQARLADGPLPMATFTALAGGDRDVQLFTHDQWASTASYLGWPQVLVAIDTRLDVYGPALVADYREVIDARPGWRDWLADHGVTDAVVPADVPLARALDGDACWRRVRAEPVRDGVARSYRPVGRCGRS